MGAVNIFSLLLTPSQFIFIFLIGFECAATFGESVAELDRVDEDEVATEWKPQPAPRSRPRSRFIAAIVPEWIWGPELIKGRQVSSVENDTILFFWPLCKQRYKTK